MTRPAVEQWLKDNPDSLPTSANAPPEQIADTSSDQHPMNRGLLQAHVGSLVVYMHLDNPGRYWLDMFAKYPASEAQAVAAFGRKEVARHRVMAEDLAVDKRIERAIGKAVAQRDGVKSPEELRAERTAELRARAQKAIREQEKKSLAAADRQRTTWLDKEALPQG